jgi:hypothetical protein
MADLGWWTISGERLLELLRRVEAGETADAVYAEEYANSEVEKIEGSGRDGWEHETCP